MVPRTVSVLIRLLLLTLFWLLLPEASLPPAASASTMWRKALVTQDQLAAATMTQTLQLSEDLLCAIRATQTPWCHSFIHDTRGCVLYDVLVDSQADPPPGDQDAVACMTRHHNVCIHEGEAVPQGKEKEIDCFPWVCRDHVLVQVHSEFSTCTAPFSSVGLGCVYLIQEEKTWCEARRTCHALDADLVVPAVGDFNLLRTFLKNNAPTTEVWMGVKARKWLDGRDVADDEWNGSQPNGDLNECGLMTSYTIPRAFDDRWCNISFAFLCMRKIV